MNQSRDPNRPLFSVVMPAYNSEVFIRQAIESIVAQTYPNWQLLISDDASTDRTRSIIDSFKDDRIKTFHNQSNIGYLRTCNRLFELAQGAFLTFQDADDYSHPERLQNYLAFFSTNPEIDFCGTDYYRIGVDGTVETIMNFPSDAKHFPVDFPLIGAALCIKRAVYDEIGGYHEYFDRIGSEDFYWFGLMLEKFRFANIQAPLYYYRFNPRSVSKTNPDIRSKFGHDIVRFLILQRREYGTDSLNDSNRADELQQFIKSNSIKHLFRNRRYKDGLLYSLRHPGVFAAVLTHFLSPPRRLREVRQRWKTASSTTKTQRHCRRNNSKTNSACRPEAGDPECRRDGGAL